MRRKLRQFRAQTSSDGEIALRSKGGRMKVGFLVPFVLCVAMQLCAQAASAPIYAESFRQGPTRIVEERFEVKLTPEDSVYREPIKDSHGADRFVFSIIPHGPEGDTEITSWQVKLADEHHTIYDNVLLTTQQPSDGPEERCSLAVGSFQICGGAITSQAHYQSGELLCGASGKSVSFHASRFSVPGFDDACGGVNEY